VGSDFNFFPVHGDNPVGANHGTIGTTCALIGIGSKSIPVPFMVNFPGYGNYFRRARSNTNFAAFAALNVDYDNSSDFSHLVKKLK